MDRPDDLPDDFEPSSATPPQRIDTLRQLLEHLITQLEAERIPAATNSRYLSRSLTHLEEAQHWLRDYAQWLASSHR